MTLDLKKIAIDYEMQAPVSVIDPRQSRIRKKLNVEVELVLIDGTKISGNVFIGLEERVQDLLNDPKLFFPVRLANQDILLINKQSIALCKPLDVSCSASA